MTSPAPVCATMRGRSSMPPRTGAVSTSPPRRCDCGRGLDHGDDAGAADAEPATLLQEALELGRGRAGPRDDDVPHALPAVEQPPLPRVGDRAGAGRERHDQRDKGEEHARRVRGEPGAEPGRDEGERAGEHDGKGEVLDEEQAVVDARDAAAGGEAAVPDEAGEHEQAHAGEQRAVRGHGLVRQARIEPAPVEEHLPGHETGEGRRQDVEQEEEAARQHPGVGSAWIGLGQRGLRLRRLGPRPPHGPRALGLTRDDRQPRPRHDGAGIVGERATFFFERRRVVRHRWTVVRL